MTDDKTKPAATTETETKAPDVPQNDTDSSPASEKGGRKGPEPTRYGDWEKGGIAVDF